MKKKFVTSAFSIIATIMFAVAVLPTTTFAQHCDYYEVINPRDIWEERNDQN